MEYKQEFIAYQRVAKKTVVWYTITLVTSIASFLALMRIAWLLSQPSFGGVELGIMPYIFFLGALVAIPAAVICFRFWLQLRRQKPRLQERLLDRLTEAKDSGETRAEIEIEEMRRKLEKGLLFVAQ